MVNQGVRGVKERLEDAIQLAGRVSRVRSITVTRRDGLVIVHRVERGQDPRAAAAMAAATVGSASVAAQELRQGAVERVIIECSAGKMVAVEAGGEAIILALCDREADLGPAIEALSHAAQAINIILQEFGTARNQ